MSRYDCMIRVEWPGQARDFWVRQLSNMVRGGVMEFELTDDREKATIFKPHAAYLLETQMRDDGMLATAYPVSEIRRSWLLN